MLSLIYVYFFSGILNATIFSFPVPMPKSTAYGTRMYWTKLTLDEQGNVIEPVGTLEEIGGGIDAGECAEIADEMGLIVVAAGERQIGPLHAAAIFYTVQRGLEPLDAVVELRRHAHLLAEYLDEPPLAEPHIGSNLGQGTHMRHAFQFTQRMADGGMQIQPTGHPLKKG